MTAARRTRPAAALLAGVATLAVAVAVASAHGLNGGSSIATAPPLPLGTTVTSGWDETAQVDNTGQYGEFWLLNVHAGDKLVVDWAHIGGCGWGWLRFYDPKVTDFTISQTQGSTELNTNGASKYEFTWTAPVPGNWTVFMHDGVCKQISYTFLATLQVETLTTLNPPPALVGAGSKVPVRGHVDGASAGKVLIVVSGPKGFTRVGKVVALHGGGFAWTFVPRLSGRYRLHASFPGDAGHRPSSSRAYTVKVGS